METQYVSADQLLVSIDTPLTGLRLAEYPLQPVRFKLPRIPGQLLQDALADARPASRKYARRRDGGKGGWITRAETFISSRFQLTEAQHRARVAAWAEV